MLFSNTMEKYSGENVEARPGNGQYFMTSLYHDHPAKGLTHRNRRTRMHGLFFSNVSHATTMDSQDGGRWLAKSCGGGGTVSQKEGIFDLFPWK